LDDLAAPRSLEEAAATVAGLYGRLGNLYLRLRGQWSGGGKWLPRLLERHDAAFAKRFVDAFGRFWKEGDVAGIRAVAGEVLAPAGGLFTFAETYRRNAPESWRKPVG
jgi:hypothetical protein